jgi:hypothetical protein
MPMWGTLTFFSIFAINSETRHLTVFIPFAVFGLMKAMSSFHLSSSFLCCYSLGSFAFSKCWLFINSRNDMVTDKNILHFPWQWYYMNNGPRISGTSYIIGIVFFIFSLISMKLYFNKNKLK